MDRSTLPTFVVAEQPQPRSRSRYEDDLHAWAKEQAELLMARRFDDIDVANVADEIADVARRQYEALESNVTRIVQHLLKWDYQPARRSASWAGSIKEHRRRSERLIAENPSLKPRLGAALQEGFDRGRAEALIELGWLDDAIPSLNPYTWDVVMSRPITWP